MWQTIRGILVLCTTLWMGGMALSAQAEPDPADFVDHLGQSVLKIIQSPDSPQDRKEAMTQLFTTSFDVPVIAKFALGRYWRIATPAQQQQYQELFGRYIVAIYAERFNNYAGEQFKVLQSHPGEDGTTIVTSQIVRPQGGAPIHIDWKIGRAAEGDKITDVIVEGLSMLVAQRDEFTSVIVQGGGQVQALIKVLQQKVQGG